MPGTEQPGQTHWIPLSDLMTGLMMIFMLISAVFMLRVEQTTTLVVVEHEVTRDELIRALQDEFRDDLKQWNAEVLGDMTLRFRNPEVLFATGSATLRPKFQEILENFVPRYVALLKSEKFRPVIKEVRIEGHTSRFWASAVNDQEAYFRNMELSQARTRSVLEYVMRLPALTEEQEWFRQHVTANGLSSSRPVAAPDGGIDEEASQRVEFRIVTNADEQLEKLSKGLARK